VGLGENVITDLLVINRAEEWEIKSTASIENYTLINAMGQVVMSENVKSEKLVIAKDGLVKGVYVLRLRNTDRLSIVKLNK
jgi:hypothetical protein